MEPQLRPLATPQDVRDRWFLKSTKLSLSDEQLAVVIGDAEDLILQEFPNLHSQINEVTLPARRVTRVVCRVVIRYLRNPDGWRQVQSTTGSLSQGGTLAGDFPGELHLTAADRDELTPVAEATGPRRAFIVPPVTGGGTYVRPAF